jgi:hypothetical protein
VCSPAVLPPALIAGRRFIDGGIVDPLPILRARALGDGKIVAVDLKIDDEATGGSPGMLNTYCRALAILGSGRLQNAPAELSSNVIRIHPSLSRRSTFDVSRAEELIDAGYQASLAGLTSQDETWVRRNTPAERTASKRARRPAGVRPRAPLIRSRSRGGALGDAPDHHDSMSAYGPCGTQVLGGLDRIVANLPPACLMKDADDVERRPGVNPAATTTGPCTSLASYSCAGAVSSC